MKVLILNSILRTAENGIIPAVDTIKDSMIYNLALGFKHLGHEVTLIATEGFKPTKEESYDFEVIFQKAFFKKLFKEAMFPLQLGLINYLIKNKKSFDLIITSEVFAIPSLFAAIISPKNTIVWHEVNVFPKMYRKIPAKIWYYTIVPLFFQRALVVPRSIEAGKFIRQYVKHVSNTIVEHGVNLDNFICSKEKKNQFIIVSQLVPRKNVKSSIYNFYKFINKYNLPHFKLLIAGKGNQEKEIMEQIARLNLENNVTLLGFVPHKELGILISQSVAMLVSTLQDLNMVSIPEAIVSGTPVITNSIPITSSFISKYNLGVVKDDWNEDDLYELLINKESYIDSCITQRSKLSIEQSSKSLINSYLKFLP